MNIYDMFTLNILIKVITIANKQCSHCDTVFNATFTTWYVSMYTVKIYHSLLSLLFPESFFISTFSSHHSVLVLFDVALASSSHQSSRQAVALAVAVAYYISFYKIDHSLKVIKYKPKKYEQNQNKKIPTNNNWQRVCQK